MSLKPPSASALSTKQLARTVIDGSKVTFDIPSRDSITGYVCGMDDYHWMVVSLGATPGDVQKHLVHKGGAAVVTLHSGSTFEDESDLDREAMHNLVGPFKRWVEEHIFGRKSIEAVA